MIRQIKVLVVDDSLLFRKLLTDKLSTYERIQVIGAATNALEAEKMIMELNPDVVTMDVNMPGKSGIDFVKTFLPKKYVNVVLISSLSMSVFEALSVGAVDFVQKPDMRSMSTDSFITNLVTKIYIASTVKPKANVVAKPQINLVNTRMSNKITSNKDFIIALGASTGGTEATLQVLEQLPADIPPMLMVQHMPETFTDMYAQRLNRICKMEVREAKNNDELKRGLVLLAPGNKQMELAYANGKYFVKVFDGEKVSGHKPSVDVLFSSVARINPSNSVGIILTGMGNDGAAGLLQMKKKGAFTIGQDKDTSVVYGMPKVAYDMGAVAVQAPCASIAGVLVSHINMK